MGSAYPVLFLQLDDLSIAGRDRLVALLDDYDLTAIHEDDPVSSQTWTAHFATSAARDAAAERIRREFGDLGVTARDVEDEDWARRTQADLPAIHIGRVIVAPPWDLPSALPPSPSGVPHSGTVVVVIEPSRGFGTGHHQSTRLCLALLQTRNVAGQTMIDVGTGSGVIAITAALLGAAYVAAIDVDPDAVENARENIATNDVGRIVEAHVEDFTAARRSPADIVTANLTGTLLSRYPAELGRLVRPTGTLIVSGFNVDEKSRVEGAFAESFAVTEAAEEEGWWAFVLSPQRVQSRERGNGDRLGP